VSTAFEDASDPAVWEAIRDVTCRSFAFDGVGEDRWAGWNRFAGIAGRDIFRALRRNGEVVAALCTYRAGQWFGGRAVPMGGLAAVAVAPEQRGTGAGRVLVAEQLRELRTEGIPLATLYASTQALYRAFGFEQAGSCCRWSLPMRDAPILGRDLSAERIELTDPLLRGLHRMRAMSTPGTLDRSDAFWQRLVRAVDKPVYAYLLGTREDPHGYVIFVANQREDGLQRLVLRDAVALTHAGLARLWTLLADHRSIARELHWQGPSTEPMLLVLPEQQATLEQLERWMLRIVDVPGALAARGFPADAEAELHLEVSDPLLEGNQGRWLLRVADGVAEVESGGRGDLQATPRGLAPLYSGLLRAGDLARLGLVDGTPASLAVADRLFAGAEPWMADRF